MKLLEPSAARSEDAVAAMSVQLRPVQGPGAMFTSGDVIAVVGSGAAGYGDVLERDPEAVALDVRREPPSEAVGTASSEDLLIEVEVANFYPSISVGFSEPVYEMTQSAVHVLVTHAFLRSLARLNLARSKVGQFADQPDAEDWDAAAERSRESAAAQP